MCLCVSQVISGQQLPKVNQKEGSIVDPLVRVEIYGTPQDQTKEETSHINNNGEHVFFFLQKIMHAFLYMHGFDDIVVKMLKKKISPSVKITA